MGKRKTRNVDSYSPKKNAPSCEIVAKSLEGLGGNSTAKQLYENIMNTGYSHLESHFGIFRAVDRGYIRFINSDWSMCELV